MEPKIERKTLTITEASKALGVSRGCFRGPRNGCADTSMRELRVSAPGSNAWTPAKILLGQMPASAPENRAHCRIWPEIPDRPSEAKIGVARC
jgi:hypothetical protein